MHEAHKYVAVAHHILAPIAIARGDLRAAAARLDKALDELRDYPAPLLAWRINAILGRLCDRLGAHGASRQAWERSAEIVRGVAENIRIPNCAPPS